MATLSDLTASRYAAFGKSDMGDDYLHGLVSGNDFLEWSAFPNGTGNGNDFAGIPGAYTFTGAAAQQALGILQNVISRGISLDDLNLESTSGGTKISFWYDKGDGDDGVYSYMGWIKPGVGDPRVRKYLDGTYKWTPYAQSQLAVIYNLYVDIAPDDPRNGYLRWDYSLVSVLAPKAWNPDFASKKVNSAWNLALNQVSEMLNAGKFPIPTQAIIMPIFNKLFIANADLEGLQVLLNTAPFGVSLNDKTVSFARYKQNLGQ